MSCEFQSRASPRLRPAGFAQARASAVLRPAGNFLSGDKKSPKNTFSKSLPWRSCFGKRGESLAPHSEGLRIPAGLLARNSAHGCCQQYFYSTAVRMAQCVQCRSCRCNTIQSGALRGLAVHRCSSSVAVFFKGVSLVTFFALAKKVTRSAARRVEALFFQSAISARCEALRGLAAHRCSSSVAVFSNGVSLTRSSAGRVEALFFPSAIAAP